MQLLTLDGDPLPPCVAASSRFVQDMLEELEENEQPAEELVLHISTEQARALEHFVLGCHGPLPQPEQLLPLLVAADYLHVPEALQALQAGIADGLPAIEQDAVVALLQGLPVGLAESVLRQLQQSARWLDVPLPTRVGLHRELFPEAPWPRVGLQEACRLHSRQVPYPCHAGLQEQDGQVQEFGLLDIVLGMPTAPYAVGADLWLLLCKMSQEGSDLWRGEDLRDLQLLGMFLSQPTVQQQPEGQVNVHFSLPILGPSRPSGTEHTLNMFLHIVLYEITLAEAVTSCQSELVRGRAGPGGARIFSLEHNMLDHGSFAWIRFADRQPCWSHVRLQLQGRTVYECTPEENRQVQLALAGQHQPWLVPIPLFLCNPRGEVSTAQPSLSVDSECAYELRWMAFDDGFVPLTEFGVAA